MEELQKFNARRYSAEEPLQRLLSPTFAKSPNAIPAELCLTRQKFYLVSSKNSTGFTCYNMPFAKQNLATPIQSSIRSPSGLFINDQWRPRNSVKYNFLHAEKQHHQFSRTQTAKHNYKSLRNSLKPNSQPIIKVHALPKPQEFRSLLDQELLQGRKSPWNKKIPFENTKKALHEIMAKFPDMLDAAKIKKISFAGQMKMNLGEKLAEKVMSRKDIIALQLMLEDKERQKYMVPPQPNVSNKINKNKEIIKKQEMVPNKPPIKRKNQNFLSQKTTIEAQNPIENHKIQKLLIDTENELASLKHRENNDRPKSREFRDLLYSIKEDDLRHVKLMLDHYPSLIHMKDHVFFLHNCLKN